MFDFGLYTQVSDSGPFRASWPSCFYLTTVTMSGSGHFVPKTTHPKTVNPTKTPTRDNLSHFLTYNKTTCPHIKNLPKVKLPEIITSWPRFVMSLLLFYFFFIFFFFLITPKIYSLISSILRSPATLFRGFTIVTSIFVQYGFTQSCADSEIEQVVRNMWQTVLQYGAKCT